MGNLVQVIVHAANIHDTKAGCDVLKRAVKKYPTLEAFRDHVTTQIAYLQKN